ncbi:phage baseplate assembly protein V [Azospirillum sp. HJ39]|uniref:phage baseplate assembly protein V n=1 Tax=Azospirillum sp. HJ39 TaxID=3159496 RepID=UPI0035562EB2
MSQVELATVVSVEPEEGGRLYVRPTMLPENSGPILADVAQFWVGDNFGARFTPRQGDTVVLIYPTDVTHRPIVIASVASDTNDARHTVYNPTGTETVQAKLANVKDGLEALAPYPDDGWKDNIANDADGGPFFTHDIKGYNGLNMGPFPSGKYFSIPTYDEFKDSPDDESCKDGRQAVHPDPSTNRWRSVIRSKVRPGGGDGAGGGGGGDYAEKFQEIVLDDNPDAPMMAFTARGKRLDYTDGDLHEVVDKDRQVRVAGNDYRYVAGSEFLFIEGNQNVYVNGDYNNTFVGNSNSTNWGADNSLFYGSTEDVFYGEAREAMYGYSYGYTSGNAKSETYGDTDDYQKGYAKSVHDGDSWDETYGLSTSTYHGQTRDYFMGGSMELRLGASLAISLSADTEISAGLKVELTVAGVFALFLGGAIDIYFGYKIEQDDGAFVTMRNGAAVEANNAVAAGNTAGVNANNAGGATVNNSTVTANTTPVQLLT